MTSFSFSSSAEGADGVCTDLNALFTSATLPLHHVCTAMKPSPSKPHGKFRSKNKNKTRVWFNKFPTCIAGSRGSAVVRLPTPNIMGDEKHRVRKVATAKSGKGGFQRCSLLHKVRGEQQQAGVETRVHIRQADGVDAHRRQKSREGCVPRAEGARQLFPVEHRTAAIAALDCSVQVVAELSDAERCEWRARHIPGWIPWERGRNPSTS